MADETTNLVRSYTLPDGRVITLGAERFAAPEALFNPELVDVEGGGIHEAVFRCVQENDIDNRMLMYQRIVLSGGVMLRASLFPKIRAKLVEVLNGYIPVPAATDAAAAATLIVPSRWGNDAGIVGALTLAKDAYEAKRAKPKVGLLIAAAAVAALVAVALRK